MAHQGLQGVLFEPKRGLLVRGLVGVILVGYGSDLDEKRAVEIVVPSRRHNTGVAGCRYGVWRYRGTELTEAKSERGKIG